MAEDKAKKGRPISRMKLLLMNCDSYLFTINEAALLNRKNRIEFLNDFLDKGFQVVKRNKELLIRHDELRKYQDQYAKILAKEGSPIATMLHFQRGD